MEIRMRSEVIIINERELEVAKYVAKGLTNNDIAKELGISTRTVQAHLYNLMRKLGVDNRMKLVTKLISEKRIDLNGLEEKS